MHKNKILQRYLLPKFAIFSVYAVVGILLIFTVPSGNEQNSTTMTQTKKSAFSANALNITLAAIIKIAFAYCALYSKKSADTFAMEATKTYIKQTVTEYPELKKFEKILSNPQAMKNLTNFVSNNLDKSEQTAILDIVETLSGNPNKRQLVKAFTGINNIIDEHIQNNPEFVADLYTTMKNSYNTYCLSAKQLTK